ncbi:hypothetical protein DLD82_14995 [Methanospirillum stamsii]|uniref:Late embryogenesis abundant protein LEA-2 subgroup domain-containing protein n=2 Tax=Methanospirillum stamsii TaxID=1277351 RepID=A0A2V2MZH4_9EURY|nr:hypothetical protein DLD82_14995 [Methanospirillum stamsii]
MPMYTVNKSGYIIMKKICLLIFLLISTLLLCGCTALFKEPTVDVSSVDLASINATDLCLDVTLAIDNPNPFGVLFQKINANVTYLQNGKWEPLSYIEKADVDISSGENTLLLPVSAKNADLIKAGFRFLISGEITVKVEGTAEPTFFGFSPKIPFNQTRTIQLP